MDYDDDFYYQKDKLQNKKQPFSPSATAAQLQKQEGLGSIHERMGTLADSSLTVESELGDGIKLGIDKHEIRSTTFSKYTVYLILGQDKNGKIQVFRRYNQFHKMRVALVKRYPGCFIPSIPQKSISLIDDQINDKRERYLNDFVKKMTKLPHLYNSEEFQALLRSAEKDLSSSFEKWPNPTTADIINKYKTSFSQLAGQVISTQVRANIHEFGKMISQTEASLNRMKIELKMLAMSRDKMDKSIVTFFKQTLPSFEKEVMSGFTDKQEHLIAMNLSQAKFQQHEAVVQSSLKRNPYWLLYDIIKHEDRDGKAFLECMGCIQEYQNKKYQVEIKISEQNKVLSEILSGRKNNPELKYKLEVEIQQLRKEKEDLACLTDIIVALVAFIEMDRFRTQKTRFYRQFLLKLGGYEINLVQNMHEVWQDWNRKTLSLLAELDPTSKTK